MVSIQSNRISWVDWVKALSIFFVVVGHVGPRIILPFVYAFHVPAFFVISGYLYKKSWWLQTFLSFTIPVFFFSLLWFLMTVVLSGFDVAQAWEKSHWLVYRLDESRPLFTGLWFLEVLFVGRLLLGDAGFDFVRNHYKVVSLAFLILAVAMDLFNIELDWYITRIIQCFPFLGLGLFLKENDLFKWNPKYQADIAIVAGVVFVLLMMVNKHSDIMYNRYHGTFILFFANAVIGSLLLIYLCRFLKKSHVIEVFSVGTLAV